MKRNVIKQNLSTSSAIKLRQVKIFYQRNLYTKLIENVATNEDIKWKKERYVLDLEYRSRRMQSIPKGFNAAPFISSSLFITVHSFRSGMLNTRTEYKLRSLSATLSLHVPLRNPLGVALTPAANFITWEFVIRSLRQVLHLSNFKFLILILVSLLLNFTFWFFLPVHLFVDKTSLISTLLLDGPLKVS